MSQAVFLTSIHAIAFERRVRIAMGELICSRHSSQFGHRTHWYLKYNYKLIKALRRRLIDKRRSTQTVHTERQFETIFASNQLSHWWMSVTYRLTNVCEQSRQADTWWLGVFSQKWAAARKRGKQHSVNNSIEFGCTAACVWMLCLNSLSLLLIRDDFLQIINDIFLATEWQCAVASLAPIIRTKAFPSWATPHSSHPVATIVKSI